MLKQMVTRVKWLPHFVMGGSSSSWTRLMMKAMSIVYHSAYANGGPCSISTHTRTIICQPISLSLDACVCHASCGAFKYCITALKEGQGPGIIC